MTNVCDGIEIAKGAFGQSDMKVNVKTPGIGPWRCRRSVPPAGDEICRRRQYRIRVQTSRGDRILLSSLTRPPPPALKDSRGLAVIIMLWLIFKKTVGIHIQTKETEW